MKYLIFILFFPICAFANDCQSTFYKKMEAEMIKMEAEVTLSKEFLTVTMLSNIRKAAFKNNELKVIEEIDKNLYLNIADIFYSLDKIPAADTEKVIDAFESFIKDHDYYPLTWDDEMTKFINDKKSSISLK